MPCDLPLKQRHYLFQSPFHHVDDRDDILATDDKLYQGISHSEFQEDNDARISNEPRVVPGSPAFEQPQLLSSQPVIIGKQGFNEKTTLLSSDDEF